MGDELTPTGALTVEDVFNLLCKWNFNPLAETFKEQGVNGSVLDCIETAEDLEDLGVTNRVFRIALNKKIQEIKMAGGAPKALIQVNKIHALVYSIYDFNFIFLNSA